LARVLVVDDEAAVRQATVRMLERVGHEPLAVEGVAEALQLLRRERVDVVVSDWQMPSLDGFDLLELMKVEGLAVPVVMVTGFGGVANAVAAIKAGAVNYLLKPFQSEELELALAQALSAAKLRDENAARDAGDDDSAAHTLVVPTLDLMDIERRVIDHALTVSGGNRTRAAALLGIDVRTLRRKLNGPGREAGGERVPAGSPPQAGSGRVEAASEATHLSPLASRLLPAQPDKLPQGN
jgi:DNA-binding NtrC family response regulator